MRTPVILVSGQCGSDAVVDDLMRQPGTVVVSHRFDGHVVHRSTRTIVREVTLRNEMVLELAHGCTACTIRNDLLVLLRQLHRRDEVARIVVHLEPWLEPEPICWAIRHARVTGMPGAVDGPAVRDVMIAAVITCIDESRWLQQALGDADLPDGRTVAQVVVGQAEFADLLICGGDAELDAVLHRLSPRALVVPAAADVEAALTRLPSAARRGDQDHPHGPLLVGQPPMQSDGRVTLLHYRASRPFHPARLDAALEVLLDGVVRTRGRIWLASNNTQAMWLETAGGGLRATAGGKWLAAMTDSEAAYVCPQRRVLSSLIWDRVHGDRHTAMTILVCGADPEEVVSTLDGALLSAGEMRRSADWSRLPDPFGDWSRDGADAEDLVSLTDEGGHR